MSGVRVSHLGPAKAGCFIKNNLLLQLFTIFVPIVTSPNALIISPDYLSQEDSFFNVERTVLPCTHAPERYNKNSYSLRLKPTGGCISLHRGILNVNLFIRYAMNKLRHVQRRKHIVACHMTSLSQKQLDVWQVILYNDSEVRHLCK